MQRAFATQLAIDAVLVHQAEDQGRRSAEHPIELAADRLAEAGLDIVGCDPHPGIDQPDIAPRTAMASAMGLQHADPLALFKQMNGRRQTGNPGTDHTDIDPDLALEPRVLGPLWR